MSSQSGVKRKVLCVYPCHTSAFPSFVYAFRLFPKTRTLMPPMGLLIIAAYLPSDWEVRFVDEAVRKATDEEYRWADVVLTSGAHQQRNMLDEIAARAHAAGKPIVLGGPSVSACPEYYPDFDYLHIGELGDATDALIAQLAKSVERPAAQGVYKTETRLPLESFPIPAYQLIDAENYLMISVQWSSGCPFSCEFCDIPELYGRNPRFKSAERLIKELDAIAQRNTLGAVFFVDDNVIGNKKAWKQLLPHIIEWQKKNGYPVRFQGQASLDLARDEKIMELMRDAGFIEIFVGIETAETEALLAMNKKQNTKQPVLEAVRAINQYGMSITSGLIIGLDTDTEATVDNLVHFVEASNIPMPMINILYAPPRTPLAKRLEAEGRLLPPSEVVHSNVRFNVPGEVVHDRWQTLIDRCYAPEPAFARFLYNARFTHANRPKFPRRKISLQLVRHGVHLLASMFYYMGLRSTYRKQFQELAFSLLFDGQLESLVNFAVMGYHMFSYREEALAGRAQACVVSEAAAETKQDTRPAPSPVIDPVRLIPQKNLQRRVRPTA